MKTTVAVSKHQAFSTFELKAGPIAMHDDGKFRTLLFGFIPGHKVELPARHTHLGVVLDGEILLMCHGLERRLHAGDFLSVAGAATIVASGRGMVSSAAQYVGMNVFGGPIEKTGRLRYIDGCSDTLLVPPVRKGDPCLNHLHFPKGIRQTPHTHPSVRTGLVLKGQGDCIVPESDPIPLRPGCVFVVPTDALHSFNTYDQTMDVIAFHPDSDTGMTDDDHPMVNRTIVDGVSANQIQSIRTVAKTV